MKHVVLSVAVAMVCLVFADSASAGGRWRARVWKQSSSKSSSVKPYRYRPTPMAAMRIFPVGPGRPRYPSQ